MKPWNRDPSHMMCMGVATLVPNGTASYNWTNVDRLCMICCVGRSRRKPGFRICPRGRRDCFPTPNEKYQLVLFQARTCSVVTPHRH